MVTTDDMISAARDAFGMYLKDGVSTPRANRTTAPVKIPTTKINKGKLDQLQNSTLLLIKVNDKELSCGQTFINVCCSLRCANIGKHQILKIIKYHHLSHDVFTIYR